MFSFFAYFRRHSVRDLKGVVTYIMIATEKLALLNKTTDEIIGSYCPGSAPVLYSSEVVRSESTLAHEHGHRQLCDTTAIGLYISGLSLATSYTSPSDINQLRETIKSLIEQCWMCQEGYATYKQVAHLHQFGKIKECKRLIELLPESYKAALEIFDIEHISHSINQVISRLPDQVHDQIKWLAQEHVAYVIARSAMSVPLAELLMKSTTLPNYDVIIAIRDNPPDVRLEKVRSICDADFVAEVAENCLIGVSETIECDASRPLDDRMDKMARKLCDRASLEYEPSYSLDVPKIYNKLGLNNINFVDQRDMSLDESLTRETDSRTVREDWLSSCNVENELTLENVSNSVNKKCSALSTKKDSGFDIVCELLPIQKTKSVYYPLFHIFCKASFSESPGEHVNLWIDKTAPECHISEHPIHLLPSLFKHNSWTWIMHWTMFETDGFDDFYKFSYSDFAESGTVFSPLLTEERSPVGDSMNFFVSQCYSLINSSKPKIVSGSEAMLTLYSAKGIEPHLVVIKPMNENLGKELTAAPDTISRVSYSLSAGVYSLINTRNH